MVVSFESKEADEVRLFGRHPIQTQRALAVKQEELAMHLLLFRIHIFCCPGLRRDSMCADYGE